MFGIGPDLSTEALQEGFKRPFLSFYLPTLVFVSTSSLIFFPVLFPTAESLGVLSRSELISLVSVAGVATVFLGYTLMALQVPLVRFFEGYYFRQCLRPLERFHQKRRRQMFDEASKLRWQYQAEEDEDLRWYLENQFIAKQTEFEILYPLYADTVMPTAIGNVFRAFEQYPGGRYGSDAVLFWPHLTSVIPPAFAQSVEEANNRLTFLLMSCLAFGTLSIESLAVMTKLIFYPATPYMSGMSFLAVCRREKLLCKNIPLLSVIGSTTCQNERFFRKNALLGSVFG